MSAMGIPRNSVSWVNSDSLAASSCQNRAVRYSAIPRCMSPWDGTSGGSGSEILWIAVCPGYGNDGARIEGVFQAGSVVMRTPEELPEVEQ